MLPPYTDHTNLVILQFLRKNLGLLLQPNLFTDKEDFIVTPLIVIRTTKKEKDSIDDKPSGISLSLDSFRIPWVVGPEESHQGDFIFIYLLFYAYKIFLEDIFAFICHFLLSH